LFGTSSPVCFPFDNIKADALVFVSFSTTIRTQNKGALSWLWGLFSNTQISTTPISIPKYAENSDDINLAVSLQYGLATGIPQLQKFIQEFNIASHGQH
jgi:aromatic amino acid aminotransferase I